MDQFFGIGLWELLMIAVIALVVLGPRQMIILSRKAGEYLRILNQMWQKASAEIKDQLDGIEDNTAGGVVQDIEAIKNEVTKSVQSIQENLTIASPPPPNGSGQPATSPQTTAASTAPASPAEAPKPESATSTTPESTMPPKPSYSAWISKPKK